MREGWREVRLGDVATIQQGKKVDHEPPGELGYPVLGATGVVGSWGVPTYTEPRIAMGCRGTVGGVRYVDEPAWFGNNVMAIWPRPDAELYDRYLALALEGTDLERQGAIGGQVQKQITRTSLSPITLAIPPLTEQRRIVDLIGALDDAIATVEWTIGASTALTRPLMDQVLSSNGAWPLRTLDEVGEFLRGKRFTKSEYVPSGLGCIHYGQIHTTFGPVATESITFLPADAKSRLRLADPGDVVIAATSENLDDLGKATVWLGGDPVAVHDDCYIYKHSMDPVFASYVFASSAFQGQKVQYAAGMKVTRISGANLGKIHLPVPPLEVQKATAEALSAVEAQTESLRVERDRLNTLRSNLLTALLSGEHEIPETYDEFIEEVA